MNDSTDILQIGTAKSVFFNAPLSTLDIPNNPNFEGGNIFDIEISLHSDLIQINRKTESLLDILSACGGLMRALNAIVMVLLNPYTLYALKAHLALYLVRFIPSNHLSKRQKKKSTTMKK